MFLAALAASISCDAKWPTQPTAESGDWKPPAPITSVEVFYPFARGAIGVGSTFVYSVYAIHADGVYERVNSSNVVWTFPNPDVVRLLGPVLYAVGIGTADVLATYQGFTGSTTVNVVSGRTFPDLMFAPHAAPSNPLRPETARALYLERQFVGEYEDITTRATWASSNPSVATVDAGRVTAIGPGTTEITASYKGTTGFYRFSVTDAADTVSFGRNPDALYQAGATITWSQFVGLRLASARSGTFYFALVDQDNRVLTPLPWASNFVGNPGGSTTFTSTATVPAGTIRVCSQIMLVTDAGVRRTFAGTCNEVR